MAEPMWIRLSERRLFNSTDGTFASREPGHSLALSSVAQGTTVLLDEEAETVWKTLTALALDPRCLCMDADMRPILGRGHSHCDLCGESLGARRQGECNYCLSTAIVVRPPGTP